MIGFAGRICPDSETNHAIMLNDFLDNFKLNHVFCAGPAEAGFFKSFSSLSSLANS